MSQSVLKVHLEITVPQLMLTNKESISSSAVDAEQDVDHPVQNVDNQHTSAAERIEVQLVTPGTQKHPDSPPGDGSKQLMDAKLSPLMTHTKRFSTFHARDIPARG